MKVEKLMVCLLIATILISFGSTTVFAEDNCIDFDGGKNYYTKGEFSGIWQDIPITNSDSCLDPIDWDNVYSGEYLGEAYCENNILKIDHYACPGGCEDGICLEYCNDTDVGKSYCVKGTISGYWGGGTSSQQDKCKDSSIVLENYCSDAEGKVEEYICANGCSDGACLTESDGSCSGTAPLITPVACEGVYCRDGYTCKKSAYQVCLFESMVKECSEIDGDVYENCYLYDYYQAPMMEYLYDYNGNRFMISEVSGEKAKIKAIDPDTNAVLEYWISTTERKAVLSGKNTMIITIDSIFYDLNPPFGSKDRVSLRVETPSDITKKIAVVPIKTVSQEAATETIAVLETVKENAPEQATGVTTAQDKILAVNTETDKLQKEIDQRGIGYKFKWFFGMVAEQEKQDALFFKEQASKLNETAQLLLQISKQIEDPAKSVLVEQSIKLQEQSQEFLQKAEDKENHSKGLFSLFG